MKTMSNKGIPFKVSNKTTWKMHFVFLNLAIFSSLISTTASQDVNFAVTISGRRLASCAFGSISQFCISFYKLASMKSASVLLIFSFIFIIFRSLWGLSFTNICISTDLILKENEIPFVFIIHCGAILISSVSLSQFSKIKNSSFLPPLQ